VKAKRFHIVLSALLIANLLFSQVAINLLHNDHPRQRSFTDIKNSRVESKAIIKHCNVCSLDITFNLLFQQASLHTIEPMPASATCLYAENVPTTIARFLQGRAPPVLPLA